MKKKEIKTELAPKAIGPYSQGILYMFDLNKKVSEFYEKLNKHQNDRFKSFEYCFYFLKELKMKIVMKKIKI